MHDALAGAISGISSCIILQPLDVYKTRIQEHSINRHPLSLRQLWRGTVPTLFRNVPGVALYFYFFQQIRYLSVLFDKQVFKDVLLKKGQFTHLGNMVTGGSARILAGALAMPLTVLKVRFESRRYLMVESLREMFRSIVRSEGMAGLFRGFWVTTMRDAPHAAIYVSIFEAVRADRDKSVLLNALSGMVAGALATIITQPFDTVKTRIQLEPRTGYVDAARCIVLGHGWKGFYTGAMPRFIKKTLSSAIVWTVYEALVLF